ncbi:MAG: hypothetical protein H5T61_03115 [Thermoflexales bacterium]|nr:hypothetical protein [Thermoflexales bacterium]
MKNRWILLSGILAVLVLALTAGLTLAQGPEPPEGGVQPQGDVSIRELMGTAFTYQGQLKKDGNPVNGTCDFQFSLWNAASGGGQLGLTLTRSDVDVNNGLFTIPDLSFGADRFNGDARWLEIAVRCPAASGSYTTLSPRQKLNPAPYALALPGLWTRQHATSPSLIGGYSGNGVTSGVMGATISGGGAPSHINSVTDDYGTVGGGYENRAGDGTGSVADKPYATVGGGSGNTAGGEGATVSGGVQNTASGGHATIGGGIYNQVTASWDATIGGGYGNIAEGQGSTVPGGVQARTVSYGQMAYASGQFANAGDAQTSVYVVRGTTTDDNWYSLYLDGVDRQIFVASGRTMAFDILVVGRTQAGKSNGYRITGVVENVSGSPSQWHSVSTLHEDDTGWGTQVMVAADGCLHVQVNGDTGDTVRWVAVVHTAEVSW